MKPGQVGWRISAPGDDNPSAPIEFELIGLPGIIVIMSIGPDASNSKALLAAFEAPTEHLTHIFKPIGAVSGPPIIRRRAGEVNSRNPFTRNRR